MTISAKAVGEEPARARTPACQPAPPGNRHASPTTRHLSRRDRQRAGYRALVAASRDLLDNYPGRDALIVGIREYGSDMWGEYLDILTASPDAADQAAGGDGDEEQDPADLA